MNALVKFGGVSVIVLAAAAPAFAQQYPTYRPTPDDQYQQQQQQYDYQRQQYEQSRQNYEESRDRYQSARADYRTARADYERRLADWENARVAYDARWGYGAYARRYPRPVWDENYWASAAPPYSGSYSSSAPAPYAGSYGYNASANVRCDHDTAVGAGVVGAIAGAILGSNVAGHGAKTEGSVLGALVGGGVGAAVGNAHDRYKCDTAGPYFAYSDTVPYRESRGYRYGSNDYAYYERMRCRLAAAPVDSYGRDYRYVRVCPDASGRYRITG